MGINRQSEESANLQVGPTTEGMVRIYVASETIDLPMDFTPDDAEEIARELLAAAETARRNPERPSGKGKSRANGGRERRRPGGAQPRRETVHRGPR